MGRVKRVKHQQPMQIALMYIYLYSWNDEVEVEKSCGQLDHASIREMKRNIIIEAMVDILRSLDGCASRKFNFKADGGKT